MLCNNGDMSFAVMEAWVKSVFCPLTSCETYGNSRNPLETQFSLQKGDTNACLSPAREGRGGKHASSQHSAQHA